MQALCMLTSLRCIQIQSTDSIKEGRQGLLALPAEVSCLTKLTKLAFSQQSNLTEFPTELLTLQRCYEQKFEALYCHSCTLTCALHAVSSNCNACMHG